MRETKTVTIRGLRPVMFDRYAGDNNTKLEPYQKLYLHNDGAENQLITLPAANIMSFLSAQNTNSAPKRLRDPRKYKALANAVLSSVDIDEELIPFTRDGEPVRFGRFENDRDELSGVYIHRSVARLDKGVPNPKVRPVLPTPWELRFTLNFYPNNEVKLVEVYNLLKEGGVILGLGTFRGVFGKFEVVGWD